MVTLMDLVQRVEAIDHRDETRRAEEARRAGLEARLAELRPQVIAAQAAREAAEKVLSAAVKSWRTDTESKPLVAAHRSARGALRVARERERGLAGEMAQVKAALAGSHSAPGRWAALRDKLQARQMVLDAAQQDFKQAETQHKAVRAREREQGAAYAEGRPATLPAVGSEESRRALGACLQAAARVKLAERQVREIELELKDLMGEKEK